jgi:hypothetical protein
MIGSHITNPVYFLDTSGSYPNEMNRKHEDRKQGNSLIICYNQRFEKDDIVTLQFYSDSATTPVLKSYIGTIELENIALSDSSSIVGDTTRYYYNFEITFGSDYYDKEVNFIVTQDTSTLYSEPVKIEDLTDEINNGTIKILQYANLDAENDFIDWSIITDPLFIYCEGVDRKLNDDVSIENLKGSQQISIISSSLFIGVVFETGLLPAYRVRQLEAITMLDFIAVNGLEYVRQDANGADLVGNSTSFNVTSKLMQKNAISINVDDLGIESDTMEWHKSEIKRGVSASFDVAIPTNYMLHYASVRHSTGSSGAPVTLTFGSTNGGTQYYDAEAGIIDSTDEFSYIFHSGRKGTNGRLYVGISAGAGVKLDVDILFELIP